MPKLKYPTGGTVREYGVTLTPAEVAWRNYVVQMGIEDDPKVREKFIKEYNKSIGVYEKETKELKDVSSVANAKVTELNSLVEDYNTNFKPQYDVLYSEAESLRNEYNDAVKAYTEKSKELKKLEQQKIYAQSKVSSGATGSAYAELYKEGMQEKLDVQAKISALKKEIPTTAKLKELAAQYEAKVKELNDFSKSYSDKTAKYEALKKVVDDALAKVKAQKEKVGSTGINKFYKDLEYKKDRVIRSKQSVKPMFKRTPTHTTKSMGAVRLPR